MKKRHCGFRCQTTITRASLLQVEIRGGCLVLIHMQSVQIGRQRGKGGHRDRAFDLLAFSRRLGVDIFFHFSTRPSSGPLDLVFWGTHVPWQSQEKKLGICCGRLSCFLLASGRAPQSDVSLLLFGDRWQMEARDIRRMRG